MAGVVLLLEGLEDGGLGVIAEVFVLEVGDDADDGGVEFRAVFASHLAAEAGGDAAVAEMVDEGLVDDGDLLAGGGVGVCEGAAGEKRDLEGLEEGGADELFFDVEVVVGRSGVAGYADVAAVVVAGELGEAGGGGGLDAGQGRHGGEDCAVARRGWRPARSRRIWGWCRR